MSAGPDVRLDIFPARPEDIVTLKSWLPDRDAVYQWGGPHFRFPFTDESFLQDIFWDRMASCTAFDERGCLAAFGQYYPKVDRCHLARLIVDPERRSAGIGTRFVAGLVQLGQKSLGVASSSLFVVRDNRGAVRCYRKLGFEERAWPARDARLPGIIFMVRDDATAAR